MAGQLLQAGQVVHLLKTSSSSSSASSLFTSIFSLISDYLWYIFNVIKIQIQQFQPVEDYITSNPEQVPPNSYNQLKAPAEDEVLLCELMLPGEVAEGLWQRVETVSLHNEDLEFHQSLNVLSKVLQTVEGQMKEHLHKEL